MAFYWVTAYMILSLATRFAHASADDIKLYISSDGAFKLWADAQRVTYYHTKQHGAETVSVANIPADTRDLHVYYSRGGKERGFAASLSNGVVTNSSWKCWSKFDNGWLKPSFDDSHLPAAYEEHQTTLDWGDLNDAMQGAKWIRIGNRISNDMYCRKTLPDPVADEHILICLDVSESLKDYMSEVAGFIQYFYNITSTDGFVQTHNRKVIVALFNEGMVPSEEWMLDYSKYNTGAELRDAEAEQVAAIVDSIATREAEGKTNIGKALQDAKQTYSLNQNWRVILVSDFINTVDQPAISQEMAEYSKAGIKVVPVIVDKPYRREDTFNDVQTEGGGFGINLSSELDENAVSAIYNL